MTINYFQEFWLLIEKSFCITGNPIKTLLAILFLIVTKGWEEGGGGAQIANFWEKKPQYYLIIIRECSRYEFAH